MIESLPADERDRRLLERVATERDPDALARLYDAYAGLAYSLTLRMLRDPGLAEDVVQEAFFNVWRNAGRFELARGSVHTWLLSIVHNLTIDKLRRARRKHSLDVGLDAAEEVLEAPDVWRDVSARLETERIRQGLSGLPSEQRRTIELAYYGGCTQTEIAARLHIPLGTVKGRLRLGLDKLRLALADTGQELSRE
ncbi:MAG: sigma-70 family RNA polymerase sigma factor [Chloroflexota bacterium]